METSRVRTVSKTRKLHYCSWCGDWIDIGTPCKTWFDFSEAATPRMHPECYEAMQKTNFYEAAMPTPGVYRRGCWCGDKVEFCTCNNKQEGKR